jgi:hypothetical protein
MRLEVRQMQRQSMNAGALQWLLRLAASSSLQLCKQPWPVIRHAAEVVRAKDIGAGYNSGTERGNLHPPQLHTRAFVESVL